MTGVSSAWVAASNATPEGAWSVGTRRYRPGTAGYATLIARPAEVATPRAGVTTDPARSATTSSTAGALGAAPGDTDGAGAAPGAAPAGGSTRIESHRTPTCTPLGMRARSDAASGRVSPVVVPAIGSAPVSYTHLRAHET